MITSSKLQLHMNKTFWCAMHGRETIANNNIMNTLENWQKVFWKFYLLELTCLRRWVGLTGLKYYATFLCIEKSLSICIYLFFTVTTRQTTNFRRKDRYDSHFERVTPMVVGILWWQTHVGGTSYICAGWKVESGQSWCTSLFG